MASTNFKLFDENKTNMMSDTEYNINTQRLNGVQAGIASSQLQNKTLHQTSLVAYSLAQIMMQNGYDANDSAAVSAFVGNMSNSLLQKVLDKATSAEVQAGTNNIKYLTPLTAASVTTPLNKKIDDEIRDRKNGESIVKLFDLTIPSENYIWSIDVSSIDLTLYQKLTLCPHLNLSSDQWAKLRFNDETRDYINVPAKNDPNRQNFGIVEFDLLIELPSIEIVQYGISSNSNTVKPGAGGVRGPRLGDGVTRLNTINFAFSSYILEGSNVQIYGLKK